MRARTFNILLSSAGRRVELLELFRATLRDLGIAGRVYAGDADPTAPTLHKADAMAVLPPITSPSYVDCIRRFCLEHSINLVVPLIDPELDVLASVRDLLMDEGIMVMVSDKSTIAITQDKLKTSLFFADIGLSTPKTFAIRNGSGQKRPTAEELCDALGLPLVFKPRFGSSGNGVLVCKTSNAVAQALEGIEGDYIAQQYVDGVEVTTDLFGDGNGKVLSLVPRKRLKVRGGEVERGVTVSDSLFRDDMLRLARELKPFGAVNVQCFVSKDGPMYTEINGRFGGGYPLAHAAGARFPELIIRIALGQTPPSMLGEYKVGTVMSRYDEAVYNSANVFPDGHQLLRLPYPPSHGGS